LEVKAETMKEVKAEEESEVKAEEEEAESEVKACMATTQQSKVKLEKMKEAEVKAERLGVKAEEEEKMNGVGCG
jgi:hypothetical protein